MKIGQNEPEVQNNQEETNKSERKAKVTNVILIVAIILLILAIIYVALVKEVIQPKVPEPDQNAVPTTDLVNTPELSAMGVTNDFMVKAMPAIICNQKTGYADIYFTLPETDSVYARCEIYVPKDSLKMAAPTGIWNFFARENRAILDDGYVLIGKSGLIKPGQTLTSIHLSQIPIKSTDVRIKYISYVPDTHISGGNFAQLTTLYIVDGNGKILDKEGTWIEAEVKVASN